jgi:hypothetical protein
MQKKNYGNETQILDHAKKHNVQRILLKETKILQEIL